MAESSGKPTLHYFSPAVAGRAEQIRLVFRLNKAEFNNEGPPKDNNAKVFGQLPIIVVMHVLFCFLCLCHA